MVLAATDPTYAHESNRLKRTQVLADGLSRKVHAMLHGEAGNEGEKRLPILVAQFVQNRSAGGGGESFIEVSHGS
jgi:hypothetical protein